MSPLRKLGSHTYSFALNKIKEKDFEHKTWVKCSAKKILGCNATEFIT